MSFSDEVSREYESSNKHVYNNQNSGRREFLIRYNGAHMQCGAVTSKLAKNRRKTSAHPRQTWWKSKCNNKTYERSWRS